MMNAIITIIPNVIGLVNPISGAINNPKITAGTIIKKDTKNLEAKLIVCFLPQFLHSTGLYELHIDNNSSFQLKLLLHTSHFCKTVPPMIPINLFLSYHKHPANGLPLICPTTYIYSDYDTILKVIVTYVVVDCVMEVTFYVSVLTCALIYYFYKQKIYIQTALLAIVMALGIFTEGVLLHYLGLDFFRGAPGKLLSIIIISIWLSFFGSILMTVKDRSFNSRHVENPLNRFGIGTWIASTSICGIIINEQFNPLYIPELITVANFLLWICYMSISVHALRVLDKNSYKVHGIILLTTVSTQSLVLLTHAIFGESSLLLFQGLILTGIIMYVVSLVMIMKRYLKSDWSIAHDWNNSNCIIHGALSITGLAAVTSGAAPSLIIEALWVMACIMFVFVEILEIYRLIIRLRYFGIRKGIFTYNVSQWSRIFTFAMYYTFTIMMKPEGIVMLIGQELISSAGVWVLVGLLLIQTAIWFSHFTGTSQSNQLERKPWTT